ncbi:hypothetical protein Q9966_002110 [Columba livia]|nr:hypothetical protein Q9966_002110 [Columba livia]
MRNSTSCREALALNTTQNSVSIPMHTLQCYNDYMSLTTCTWMECSEAHQLLNVTLNHGCEKNKEMTCRSHKGENHADCQNFTMHWVCDIHACDEENYNFEFDLTLQAELDVYLFQNVQTLPPQNLSVSLMTSGDFLLTWKAADGSQGLGNALEHEVTYKRDWESWELTPICSEGGLQPRNLCCLFNGADHLTCSWEVKKAIITSVIFGLFFRATPASAEEECSPVQEKSLPHVPYVVQSCEIPVSNSSSQSHYHVSVRAKKEEKLINARKNIKVMPPTNVSVTVTENQEYELRWIKHTLGYGFIKQRYEVKYWKNNQYEKTLQKLNINNDEPPFTFTQQMLASSTEYRGKMRARVNTPLDYEGPWSEWSEEIAWKTENVLPPVVLPVMLPVLIITLLIITYCSYRYFLRKKQMWEEKIPNPSKSLLIQSYLEKAVSQCPVSQVGLYRQNTSEELEPINCLQVLNGMTKSSAEFHGAEAKTVQTFHDTLAPQNSCQNSGVPHKTSFSLSALIWPLNQTAGPSCQFARLPLRSASHASIASQTCFAFNGPYLYSSMMSSQPDMHQTLQVNLAGLHGKSLSLQYVTLPKEDCPHAPQGQEQPGAGPPQPFPDQKEMMQHLSDQKEVPSALLACEQDTNMRTEEQKSPKALSCITSPQHCPLEYITTESLLMPSASGSTHLPLVTAGESPGVSQEPQLPSDHSCHEFSPGKTGVMVPVSGQAPTSSPELHLDVFEDSSGIHGPSEPTKMSLHIP